MAKILLVAPTNSACNDLEDRLQRLIHLFDDIEDVWMNLLQVYLRLQSKEDTPYHAHFREAILTCYQQLVMDSLETV